MNLIIGAKQDESLDYFKEHRIVVEMVKTEVETFKMLILVTYGFVSQIIETNSVLNIPVIPRIEVIDEVDYAILEQNYVALPIIIDEI